MTNLSNDSTGCIQHDVKIKGGSHHRRYIIQQGKLVSHFPYATVQAGVAQRFRVIESSSAPDERAACTRRHLVTEDRTPARRSGSNQPMVLEARILTCVHPGDAELGIAIMYSQRYEAGGRDPGFDAKATEVFRGLRFTAASDAR